MANTRPIASAPVGFLSGFTAGFARPLEGAALLLRHRGLKRFAVLPLLVNIFIYALVIALFIWLLASLDLQVGEWQFLGPVGGWLSTALDYVLDTLKWIIAIPIILIVCYFSFTIVGLILAAPFNEMLSARVERRLHDPTALTGEGSPGMLRDTWVSLTDALQILLRQLLWTIIVLPLIFVPFIGWIPLFIVTGWFTGLGLVDPTLARHRRSRAEKDALMSARAGEVFGLGVATELMLLVPFLGLGMLPVAVTAGTIIAVNADPGTRAHPPDEPPDQPRDEAPDQPPAPPA